MEVIYKDELKISVEDPFLKLRFLTGSRKSVLE